MNFSSRLAAVLATLLCAPAASALSLQEAQRAMEAHNPDLRAAALELRGVQGDAQTAALRPATELSIGTSKISPKHGIGPGRWQDKRVDSTVGLAGLGNVVVSAHCASARPTRCWKWPGWRCSIPGAASKWRCMKPISA